MEYGKPFGIASGSTLAVATGIRIGYGWIVAGVAVSTIICIIAIKLFFRHGSRLGK